MDERLMQGDIIQGRVLNFAGGGEGVVKVGDCPVFIPFAVEGELVRAKVTFAKKDCAFAQLLQVQEESVHRVKPICPYYTRCGGCDLQHLDRQTQLEIKQRCVKNALLRTASVDVDVPLPVRLNDWEYRNKISLPFGYNQQSKRVSLGFFEKRSHKVVPMKWCPLHADWASKLIQIVCDWANECQMSVYDESKHSGVLRHLVARKLDSLFVTIVGNAKTLANAKQLQQKLDECFDDVVLYFSPNTKKGNVIMGDSTLLIGGVERAQQLGKLSAFVSPQSFLQVNNEVRDVLYDKVCDCLDGAKEIVELYSGVGLLTAQIALRMKDVSIVGVEIVPDASKDAERLMQSLGVQDRVRSVCADAAQFVAEGVKNHPAALLLDPPRRGCDRIVLERAMSGGYDKIVYVSCNPQTLARDVKILLDEYSVDSIFTFDMFPQSCHVETVCLLTKK